MPERPEFGVRDRWWLWLARLALRGMSNEAARWLFETMRWLYGRGLC